MNNAFYSSSIREFVDQRPETVLGHLARKNPFALDAFQRNAWLSQIELLRTQLDLSEGWIAFEFSIPRMGKRADVVLIIAGVIFVLEFKVGSQQFDPAASDQVVDYALDLKNFHAGSHARQIVPVVLATMAMNTGFALVWGNDAVALPIRTNGSDLGDLIRLIVSQVPKQLELDGEPGRERATNRRPPLSRRPRHCIKAIESKTSRALMQALRTSARLPPALRR
jgi:hypothetical protein